MTTASIGVYGECGGLPLDEGEFDRLLTFAAWQYRLDLFVETLDTAGDWSRPAILAYLAAQPPPGLNGVAWTAALRDVLAEELNG